MSIHLSDEQRQALAAGQAVEVIDADSQLPVIVLAAEHYRQRIQEVTAEAPASLPPADTPSRLPPVPCCLRDLVTPPEVAAAVKAYCARCGMWRKKDRIWAEEQLKLQRYFGGTYVGYLQTAAGCVVVAAGQLDSEEFGRQLDALPREQRQQVVLFPPPVWNDEVSQVPAPYL